MPSSKKMALAAALISTKGFVIEAWDIFGGEEKKRTSCLGGLVGVILVSCSSLVEIGFFCFPYLGL
jgi:hypothetical protein